MGSQSIQIKDPTDFEKVVALSFKRKGCQITMPPANTQGYDIELHKDNECIAVQVKNHKAKCTVAHVQKFQSFLEQPSTSNKFTQGWFISASGYSQPALTDIKAEQPKNLRLGIFTADEDSCCKSSLTNNWHERN